VKYPLKNTIDETDTCCTILLITILEQFKLRSYYKLRVISYYIMGPLGTGIEWTEGCKEFKKCKVNGKLLVMK